jgi:hypothetical protein
MFKRWTIAGIVALVTVLNTPVKAAFTDNFDVLRNELSARSAALSSSPDKAELKKKKTCDKVIATIDKSTSLSGDIKTAGKISKSLAKAFPDEFSVTTLAAVTFSNNLPALISGVFSGFVDGVGAQLDDLQATIDGLPAGSAKEKSQELHDAAEAFLTQDGGTLDFTLATKSLTSALKDVLKGVKATTSGNGGGGSVGNATLKCSIDGKSFTALGAGGTYVSLTGQFDVLGGTAQKGVNVTVYNVTGPGTYPAEPGCYVLDLSSVTTYGNNVTGTVTFTTLDFGTKKAIGTFSFSADQSTPPGSGHVDVTSGQFNVDFP